jgi:hypothetical protein
MIDDADFPRSFHITIFISVNSLSMFNSDFLSLISSFFFWKFWKFLFTLSVAFSYIETHSTPSEYLSFFFLNFAKYVLKLFVNYKNFIRILRINWIYNTAKNYICKDIENFYTIRNQSFPLIEKNKDESTKDKDIEFFKNVINKWKSL